MVICFGPCAQVQGDGGAITFTDTESPGVLQRWMVAGLHLPMIMEEH